MPIRLLLLALLFVVAPLHAANAHGESHPEAEHSETAQEPAETADTVADAPPAEPKADHDETGPAGLLANLHPATVHFPIALLLFAAFAELVAMMRGSARMANAASMAAAAGGIGATVAALFGWIHTGLWFGGEAAMAWHRWIGTVLGVAGPLIAWLALRDGSRTAFRALLFTAAVALLAQGWIGGELAHGAGHLFK